jgi:hypothetical protein
MKLFTSSFVLFCFLVLVVCVVTTEGDNSGNELRKLLPEIEKTILKARQNIWDEIETDEPVWNFPPWLGTFFLSEYYFELKGKNYLN